MSTNEILTLQFGDYSNNIGAHWWNIQESSFNYTNPTLTEAQSSSGQQFNHDVLFREGLTTKGEVTFTPRLLLVDRKDNLGALRVDGELYDLSLLNCSKDDDSQVMERVEITAPVAKNDFQTRLNAVATNNQVGGNSHLDFDQKQVKVWSDFLRTRFHPRTINLINQNEGINTDLNKFNCFPVGVALWHTEQFIDDFSDRIRRYIEECDGFQGFHVLLDSTDAFAGLSTACIQYLRDEYDRKAILAVPVINSYNPPHSTNNNNNNNKNVDDTIRLLNLGLCYGSLAQTSTLFVPISTANGPSWRKLVDTKREFHRTIYDSNVSYQSSAILAAALDTITLNYRLKSSSCDFTLLDLCSDLNSYGRKAAAASLCLPFTIDKRQDLIDCLDNWDGPLTQSITPNCGDIGERYVTQLLTIRGIPETRLKRPRNETANKQQRTMPAYNQCNTIKDMLMYYISCNSHACLTNVVSMEKGMPIHVPFPKLFVDNDNSDSVPVLAGLHNGVNVGTMLESLLCESSRIKYKRCHQFIEGGIDEDEYNESINQLRELRECYEENNYLL